MTSMWLLPLKDPKLFQIRAILISHSKCDVCLKLFDQRSVFNLINLKGFSRVYSPCEEVPLASVCDLYHCLDDLYRPNLLLCVGQIRLASTRVKIKSVG